MRSRIDTRLCVLALTALVTTAGPLAAQPTQGKTGATSKTPDLGAIARAIDTVKADPNLATERTIKMLRWNGASQTRPVAQPGWLVWIAGLFRWDHQSARIVVWIAAVALAGILVVYLLRTMRVRVERPSERPLVAPTHLRDLDIRPETLPPNIGAAARALWDRGEHRPALALLYRAMLSRLAHVHHVPIRDSSTEADCLALSARQLAPRRQEYALRLVGVWQRVVYGREDVQASTVYILCEDFGPALDPGSPIDAVADGGAA